MTSQPLPPAAPRKRTISLSPRAQLDLLLAPYVGGQALLVLAPMLITLALSFTQYDIFSPPLWDNFANYRHFLVDRLFQRALYNSLWFALIAVSLRVAAALLLALPTANPTLSLTAVLGVTFPFNLTLGLPLYLGLARWLYGG